jgi:hypothetical protein
MLNYHMAAEQEPELLAFVVDDDGNNSIQFNSIY